MCVSDIFVFDTACVATTGFGLMCITSNSLQSKKVGGEIPEANCLLSGLTFSGGVSVITGERVGLL